MKAKISKKQVVSLALCLALTAAFSINWYYTNPKKNLNVSPTEETTEPGQIGAAQYVNAQNHDYFDAAMLNRSKAHDLAQSTLEEAIEKTDVDAQTKEKAQDALIRLSEQIKLEADIENLISAKSGGRCLVTLGDSAEVLLENGTLNEQVSLQIKEIIVNKAQISAEKITLVEVK